MAVQKNVHIAQFLKYLTQWEKKLRLGFSSWYIPSVRHRILKLTDD